MNISIPNKSTSSISKEVCNFLESLIPGKFYKLYHPSKITRCIFKYRFYKITEESFVNIHCSKHCLYFDIQEGSKDILDKPIAIEICQPDELRLLTIPKINEIFFLKYNLIKKV